MTELHELEIQPQASGAPLFDQRPQPDGWVLAESPESYSCDGYGAYAVDAPRVGE